MIRALLLIRAIPGRRAKFRAGARGTTCVGGMASKVDCGRRNASQRYTMLWTIFVILLVLWLLGVVTSYTLGGLIHLLLVVALVILIVQLVTGRRAV
jgi:hypothetical protein